MNTNNTGYDYLQQQNQNQKSPIFRNQNPLVSPVSIPYIKPVESENNRNQIIFQGEKLAPIMEIPSFGVPSPDESPNAEGGYCFSSGIFQPNVSQDSGYCSKGGGYAY